LIQTGRMQRVPVLLFGRDFWQNIINWEGLAKAGTISDDDLDLFCFVETAQEALDAIDAWGSTDRRSDIPGRT
jgi:predicted Rossmann-fold nucleotide-binding protein